MIVLFHTNIYRKLNCYLFFPPGGEYPDGDPPGDMDPGKLKRCPLGPFIPGPFGILGWNLAVVSKVCDSVFLGGTTRCVCVSPFSTDPFLFGSAKCVL